MSVRKDIELHMLYSSHRGGGYYTPENTMPAFYDALKKRFESIETDPQYTADGVIVLLHDKTINRTCRNKDGSKIEKTIYVSDLTYDELMEYDAGIYMGEEFKGTKVPRLDELLAAAEGKRSWIFLDKKIPTDNMEPLLDMIEKYNTKVSFSVEDTERTKKILSRFPDAVIEYDGDTTEEKLKEITSLVKYDKLIIWLYLDKPNFNWLTDRAKASEENCERVKAYARLAIGNINNPYDLKEALDFEPYMVLV